MSARSPLRLLSAGLAALAVAASVTSIAEAADLSQLSGAGVTTGVATTSSRTTATQIADIQHRLTALTGTLPKSGAVEALAQSLMAVRGVKADAAPIARLAAVVSDVLARHVIAEYEIERLAQALFTASNSVALPDRDAGLLAIDVAEVLDEAGVDTPAITSVLAALQRICPAAQLPASGLPARAAARRLSVLSRQ